MNKQKNERGGILLSLLLLLSVMSVIFVQLVTDSQVRGHSLKQTENFYLVLMFEAWTINDLRDRLVNMDQTLPLTGIYSYTQGQVNYQILSKEIKFEIQVENMNESIEIFLPRFD